MRLDTKIVSTMFAIIIASVHAQRSSQAGASRLRALLRRLRQEARLRSDVQHLSTIQGLQPSATEHSESVQDTGRALPWSCGCEMFWRDLGNDYYPRFVKDGRCKLETCWFGHFVCVPTKYDFVVLKREIQTDERLGQLMHSPLLFENIQVTSSCECKRSNNESVTEGT